MDWPVVAIKAFWKLLTLSGTALLCYVLATQPMPLFGHIAIGVLAFGWLLMFVFMVPDV